MRKEKNVMDIANRIIRHVYVAGLIMYDCSSPSPHGSSKAFHIARACDLTDRFKDQFKSDEVAKKSLFTVLKNSGISIAGYNFSDHRNPIKHNAKNSLDLLVSFLFDEIQSEIVTKNFIEYFDVRERAGIISEKSLVESRKSMAWLAKVVSSVGGDASAVRDES